MSSSGNLVVLSGPSGSGKTSLANHVLGEVPGLKFSVSHTTRKPRRGERHGVEYFFVSESKYKEMIRKRAFLEYARVYGNYYGTSWKSVESLLEGGDDVLLDIDVQGGLKVKKKMPASIMVFVFPPSLKVLRERLRKRDLDKEGSIEWRLEAAQKEVARYKDYRYVIINEDLKQATSELKSIILATRCGLERRAHQVEKVVRMFQEK